ncbi:hypothetical protein ISS21_01085 [Patescibacteria group bacterium]|nr:hypothetical protein [Patescibacteria group bacterium]
MFSKIFKEKYYTEIKKLLKKKSIVTKQQIEDTLVIERIGDGSQNEANLTKTVEIVEIGDGSQNEANLTKRNLKF